jgi:hypothetical protein
MQLSRGIITKPTTYMPADSRKYIRHRIGTAVHVYFHQSRYRSAMSLQLLAVELSSHRTCFPQTKLVHTARKNLASGGSNALMIVMADY